MDGRYPDFPHHTEIHQFLREYADRFGLRERIRFSTAVEHAERLDGGRLADHAPPTARRTSSTRCSSATATTGIRRCREFPGSFDGDTLHSHHYIDPSRPARPARQAGARGRDRQQRRRHRLRAVAQGGRRAGLHLDPQRRLGDAQVRLRPAGRPGGQDDPVAAAGAAAPARAAPAAAGVRADGGLRAADPQPPLPRGPPHGLQRAAAAARLRRRGRQAQRRRAARRSGAVRRRQRRAGRRDHLRHRLQDQLPVLRPRVHLGARTTCCRSTSGCSSRGSTTWPSSGSGQAIPTIFPFAECQAKLAAPLAGRRLGAARARARWRPRSRATSAAHAPLHRPPAPHDASSTTTCTSTTCASGCCPAGQARARAATCADLSLTRYAGRQIDGHVLLTSCRLPGRRWRSAARSTRPALRRSPASGTGRPNARAVATAYGISPRIAALEDLAAAVPRAARS